MDRHPRLSRLLHWVIMSTQVILCETDLCPSAKRMRQSTYDWNVFDVNERRSWHVRATTKIQNIRKKERIGWLWQVQTTQHVAASDQAERQVDEIITLNALQRTHNTRVYAFAHRFYNGRMEWTENERERIKITMKIDDQMKNFTLRWLLPNH